MQAANRANRFPRDVFAEMGRRGYCGPMVPTEWGGLGGGVREYVVINDELEIAVSRLRAIVMAERTRVRCARGKAEAIITTFENG